MDTINKSELIDKLAEVIAEIGYQEWGSGQAWQDPTEVASVVIDTLTEWGFM